MKSNINIAYSPNNTWKDTLASKLFLLTPWRWFHGKQSAIFEREFAHFLGAKNAWAVGSGREALWFALKSLGLAKNDEVILQSFTCMVVVNAITWNDLRPIYADIDDTYNLNLATIKQRVTEKTKVVIVQHTFGIPADIKAIREFCDQQKLILIEDCAHAMGAEVDGQKVGTFGDLSIFSTGRSKCISSVSGGLVVTPNGFKEAELSNLIKAAPFPRRKTVMQNLIHPLVATLAKPLYHFFKLGRLLIVFTQRLGLLNMEVSRKEKQGSKPRIFGTQMANATAAVARIQFNQLEIFNRHRKSVAIKYHQELPHSLDPAKFPGAMWLRFPIRVNNKSEILAKAKEKGIVLGDWYSSPIAPADIDIAKTGYAPGSCPKTEQICEEVINLPTHIAINNRKIRKITKLFQ